MQRPPKLILATGSLVFSGFVYVALGVGFFFLFRWIGELESASPDEPDPAMLGAVIGGLCAILGLLCAALAIPLHRGRKWAFFVALCVFGMFVPSAFLPMGALGLWGILDKPSRDYFGALTDLKLS